MEKKSESTGIIVIIWGLGVWGLRVCAWKDNGNYYNGLYRDQYIDPFLRS